MMNGIAVLAIGTGAVVAASAAVAGLRKDKPVGGWEQDHFKVDHLAADFKDIITAELAKNYREYNLSESAVRKKLRLQSELRTATIMAPLGDTSARGAMLEKAKIILEKRLGINRDTIIKSIPFNEPDQIPCYEKFLYMYTLYQRDHGNLAFRKLMEDTGLDEPKETEEGYQIYEIDDEDIIDAYDRMTKTGGYAEQLETLAQRVYELSYGHHVADVFISDKTIDCVSGGIGGMTRSDYDFLEEMYSDVAEGGRDIRETTLRSNNYDNLWTVYRGRLIRMKFASFGSVANLSHVVKTLCQYNSKETLSRYNPTVQATFADESRVMSLRPETNDGWSFLLRKFSSTSAKDLNDLVSGPERYAGSGIISYLLSCLPQTEVSFLVTGNTGGGKTTLLKSMVKHIDPKAPIRVVETSFELSLNNLFPERNIMCLQERGKHTIFDIVEWCRKLDTEILIIGELNAPKIAGAWLQVGQSGSRFVASTGHMVSVREEIDYLTNALVSEYNISQQSAERQVVRILSFDIHQVHDADGHHYVERISEIIPYDPGEYPEDLIGTIKQFCRRMTDRKTYIENVIAVFDKEACRYRLLNNISEYTLNKMISHAGTRLPMELYGRLKEELERQKAEDPGYYEGLKEKEEAARAAAQTSGLNTDELVTKLGSSFGEAVGKALGRTMALHGPGTDMGEAPESCIPAGTDDPVKKGTKGRKTQK